MAKSSIITLIVVFALSAAASQAADVCVDLQSKITGKKFVAKKPLYDTRVSVDGIVYLERDREEIREGSKLQVLGVRCRAKKIEVTIRDPTGYKSKKIEIYFMYRESDRFGEAAMEDLEKIMSYVFEDPEEQDAADAADAE